MINSVLLPKYVVRVRTGHSEEYKFLSDEISKSAFYAENDISDDGFGGNHIKGKYSNRVILNLIEENKEILSDDFINSL